MVEQVGGKGMAQSVGRQRDRDTGHPAVALYHLPASLSGHAASTSRNEHRVGLSAFQQIPPGPRHVSPQMLDSRLPQGDQSFLSPFSHYPHDPRIDVDVRSVQVDQLRNPESGGI